MVHTVDDKQYFVFQDRSEVYFVTSVFPEHIDSQVARVQAEGILRNQSAPPLLPAYNMFMGGVDWSDQLRKTYGFDRKSKCFWLHLFSSSSTMLLIMRTYCTSIAARFIR